MAPKHPWLNSYPANVNWQFKPTNAPLYSLLDNAAKEASNAPMLNFLGKKYSYGEVAEQANSLATGLQNLGIKPGDKIGLCLPNCAYYVIAYYGALKAGATVVNFNPLYTIEELNSQIKDSQTKLMFTLDEKTLLGFHFLSFCTIPFSYFTSSLHVP